MDEERVDLSGLAPWPGSAFESAVRRVLRGATPTLESVIVRQGRAALVAVAVAAMLAWIPVLLAQPSTASTRAGELLSHWAATGERPTDVASVVGALHE